MVIKSYILELLLQLKYLLVLHSISKSDGRQREREHFHIETIYNDMFNNVDKSIVISDNTRINQLT